MAALIVDVEDIATRYNVFIVWLLLDAPRFLCCTNADARSLRCAKAEGYAGVEYMP